MKREDNSMEFHHRESCKMNAMESYFILQYLTEYYAIVNEILGDGNGYWKINPTPIGAWPLTKCEKLETVKTI